MATVLASATPRLALLLAFALAVQQAAGDCYACTSVTSGCGEPFSSSSLSTSCPSGICSKVSTSTALLGSTTTVTARLCSPISVATNCTTVGDISSGNGIKITTCFCSGDKCNSAVVGARSTAALVLSAVAAAAAMLR